MTEDDRTTDGRTGNWKRRSVLRTVGAAGAASVPVMSGISEVVEATDVTESDTYADMTYGTAQDDILDPSTQIVSGVRADWLGSNLVGGRYQHTYRIANAHAQTDGDGNYVDNLAAQTFIWDASDASANVDYAQDDESPYVGNYPAPDTEDPLENTFEEVIKAAVGAANPYAGVALTAATIINNILNWIDDITNDPNKKRWDWSYVGVLGDKEEYVGNQMDPIFRHQEDTTPTWTTRCVADSLGTEVTYYGGSFSGTTAGDANPSNASLSASTNDEGNGRDKKVVRTPGLDKEDFYGLPHPADMTRKERKKFGVRKPTPKERERFSVDGEEVQYTIERFPMTMVAEPAQET